MQKDIVQKTKTGLAGKIKSGFRKTGIISMNMLGNTGRRENLINNVTSIKLCLDTG